MSFVANLMTKLLETRHRHHFRCMCTLSWDLDNAIFISLFNACSMKLHHVSSLFMRRWKKWTKNDENR